MPGVTLCDREDRSCQSVTYAFKKFIYKFYVTLTVNEVLPTRLLHVVTNHNHPFSKVFEPQPFGSPAWKSSMLRPGHPVPPIWCFISWKAPEDRCYYRRDF